MTHYHSPIKPMAGLDGFQKFKTLVHLWASPILLIPHFKHESSRRLVIPSIVIPLMIRYNMAFTFRFSILKYGIEEGSASASRENR